jgi:uroporphyrinogen-III decarboxylase
VTLTRLIRRFQPVAEFVETVAEDVAETAEPGVSDPRAMVVVERLRVIVWFTVTLIVWFVDVETCAKAFGMKIEAGSEKAPIKSPAMPTTTTENANPSKEIKSFMGLL